MKGTGIAYVYVRNQRIRTQPTAQPNVKLWVMQQSYTAQVISFDTYEICRIPACLSETEIRREIEKVIPNPTYYFYSI
jgi:hypothetical protein